MAENLNFQPKSGKSWCFDNDDSNCKKFGRLYNWKTAKTACPSGWHLPSQQEWNDLVATAGGDTAGKALKSLAEWKGFGVDRYGFSALPGGYRDPGDFRNPDGVFFSDGTSGLWWTATDASGDEAHSRRIDVDAARVYDNNYGKNYGFSVRCLQGTSADTAKINSNNEINQ